MYEGQGVQCKRQVCAGHKKLQREGDAARLHSPECEKLESLINKSILFL